GTGPHRIRRCDMAGGGGGGVTDDLSENRRPALDRRFQPFEDQDAGPLPHYEAIAFQVKGTAGPTRLDVTRRDRPDSAKRRQREGCDAGFTAAGDHRRRVAALDDLERLADGVRPRGTGRDGAVVRSTCSE